MLLAFRFLSFGRSGNLDFAEYLGIYLGAPLSNLNDFLSEAPTLGGTVPFGRMTFVSIYTYIGEKLSIQDWVYLLDLPFRQHGNINMGNVYTIYYSFLRDFGYVGALVLIAAASGISQWLFRRSNATTVTRSDLWIICYAFVGYQLLFSFFSDKFFEEVFAFGFITTAIYLLIARYFLCYFTPGAVIESIRRWRS